MIETKTSSVDADQLGRVVDVTDWVQTRRGSWCRQGAAASGVSGPRDLSRAGFDGDWVSRFLIFLISVPVLNRRAETSPEGSYVVGTSRRLRTRRVGCRRGTRAAGRG